MTLRAAARAMLLDLERDCLEVVKQRTPRGYIRVVLRENPDWYRAFCAAHTRQRPRWRKPKTKITRRETIAALWRISRGITSWPGVYVARLLPVVESYAASQRDEERRRLAYEAGRPRIERRYRSPA